MAGGSSWPWPLADGLPLDDGLPPEPAGSAGGVPGFGFGPAPDRPRTGVVPAAGHPLAGPAGPDPLNPLPWPEPPPVMGGADPRSPARARVLTGPEAGGALDAARDRVPGSAPTERPAPRDQLEAEPADPFAPLPFAPLPFAPLPFGRGGRSRGWATRPPLSASTAFLARAVLALLAPVTTRREPELASASPSAGGGASGRSREA